MENQKIEHAPNIPKGYKWQIVNYYTPTGIKKAKHIDFYDFPTAIWKTNIIGNHLFELRDKANTPLMAYCIIVKNKK